MIGIGRTRFVELAEPELEHCLYVWHGPGHPAKLAPPLLAEVQRLEYRLGPR